jgi:hypothetical protein
MNWLAMSLHRLLLILPPLAILCSLAAGAAEPAARGSAGLDALSVTVRNTGSEPIACGAAVAHWFSVELGTVAAGEAVTIPLWRDPANGAVFTLNPSQDRLPIERLWCGRAGRSWATRSEITLPRKPGAADDIALACAPDGERLACR